MNRHNNVYDHLISTFVERQEEVAAHICSGKLNTHEEYRALCGFIDGLKYAEEYVKDLAKRLEQDADE